MKSKKLWIGVILLIVLCAGIFFWVQWNKKIKADIEREEYPVSKEKDIKENKNGYYKLASPWLITESNFEMSAATVTRGTSEFFTAGAFRTSADLATVSWETKDEFSHPSQAYPTDGDFSGVLLSYTFKSNGVMPLDTERGPVLAITTNDNHTYDVRLWNYVVDRPLQPWEKDMGVFPSGRKPGGATGAKGKVIIDFDNLYVGWTPFEESEEDGKWERNKAWKKVPVKDIKRIAWVITGEDFSTPEEDIAFFEKAQPFLVEISQWKVKGNINLGDLPQPFPAHAVRMCDNYDDVYNLTPERLVKEYKNLGYRNIVNFYIGASGYYEKNITAKGGRLEESVPFNSAFELWYKDYVKRLGSEQMKVIQSFSLEMVDAPTTWRQITYDGEPATTQWVPTPYLISFTNSQARAFLEKVVLGLATVSKENQMAPLIQLGEPWWWYIEGEEEQRPCFYDDSTKKLFLQEKGYPLPVFHSAGEEISGREEAAIWLQHQNGKLAHQLRDSLKKKFSDGEFSVLFFVPAVLDEERVPPLMQMVNFPQKDWMYPQLDFFMLENYDHLVLGQMDRHKKVMTFVQSQLKYPENKIHYFAGFSSKPKEKKVWRRIETALDDGFAQQFAHVYIWSYSQVTKAGWTPPKRFFTSTVSVP